MGPRHPANPAFSAGLDRKPWSRCSGLNRGPTVYETVALPLSYTGESLVTVATYAVRPVVVNASRGQIVPTCTTIGPMGGDIYHGAAVAG
jgi:hypothetical protein